MKIAVFDLTVNGKKEAKIFSVSSDTKHIYTIILYVDGTNERFPHPDLDSLIDAIAEYLVSKHGPSSKFSILPSEISQEESLRRKLTTKLSGAKSH
jgi:hypothetical protein